MGIFFEDVENKICITKKHISAIQCRAPDKLRICVFYAMKTSKNACIIRSEYTLRIHIAV
jgi:hypothetical protein